MLTIRNIAAAWTKNYNIGFQEYRRFFTKFTKTAKNNYNIDSW
jgi:hypothetical protein